MSNRNEAATQDFMRGAIPILKTRDAKLAAARIKVEGGQRLAKFLIEEGQKAVALGDANSAILFKNEAETVMKMVSATQAELEAAEAKQIGVLLQKRWPNFFERREIHQTATALNKTEEVVLADRANLATANRRDWKAQKRNRNIAPASQGLDSLLNTGADRDPVNEKSMCARHCQKEGVDVQGRSHCPYCQGAGFNAARKIKEGK
jgi:hypothetical protein